MKETVKYVPIQQLKPGQSTVAYREIQRKLDKEGHELKYEEGQAWVGKSDAAPAVKIAEDQYLVADKHHHITASLKAGAKIYPIRVIEDYSKMDIKKAYEKALKENLVYLEPEESIAQLMALSFGELPDNPWRYTAVVVRSKLNVKRNKKNKIENVKFSGAEYPIWAKVDDEAKPFIELGLATLMRLNKVPSYSTVTPEQNEEIRKLFVKLSDQNEKLMKNVPLIREKQKAEDVDWEKLIKDIEPFCGQLLQAD